MSTLAGLVETFTRRYGHSDVAARLVRGGAWSVIGGSVSKLAALGASVLVARMLGSEQFGEYGMVKTTVGMLLVFASVGMGATTTKYVAQYKFTEPEKVGRVIALASLVAFLVAGLAILWFVVNVHYIAVEVLHNEALVPALLTGSLLLFSSVVSAFQSGTLAGFEAFAASARVNTIAGLLVIPMVVIGASWGVEGAVLALGFVQVVICILNHRTLRKLYRHFGIVLSWRASRDELLMLWKFSLPVTVSGILVAPANWLCNTFLSAQPDGYAQLGVFEAANQWRMTILFLPAVLAQVLLPVLTGLHSDGQYVVEKQVLKTQMWANAGFALIVSIPLMAISPWVMGLYGDLFSEHWLVLCVILVSAVLIVINNIIGQSLISRGAVWAGFAFNMAWAIVLVTLSYKFVQDGYGALGLAMASLVAYGLHTLWQLAYWHRMFSRIVS